MAGIVLAVTVLPSALNLPQSNPTQTAEYAPVPGQNGSSANGNASSLGLAGSGGLSGVGAGATPTPALDELSQSLLSGSAPSGKRPTGKSCVYVDGALHQTEDPLSPPCVAYFNGDNGGATARGVTGNEVLVIMYLDGEPGTGSVPSTCSEFWDLGQPPAGDEATLNANSTLTSPIRAYAKYFNARYQTYGRTVHFWAQIGSCDYSAQSRRADAAEAVQRHPFAVLDLGGNGSGGAFLDAYDSAIAGAGILDFLGVWGDNQDSFYTQFPGYFWAYAPTLDHYADLLVSYLCTQVLPYPVHFSGNALDNGKPRSFGLLYQDEDNLPAQRILGQRIAAGFKSQCGGSFAVEKTYTGFDDGSSTSTTGDPSQAAQNWAAFKSAQPAPVTTVVWLGAWDTADPAAASAINYRPELILIGYGGGDLTANEHNFDQSVVQNAFVVTDRVLNPPTVDESCYQALKEAAPQSTSGDVLEGCQFAYRYLRQLFEAVEVAGPHLTVATIDQGMHAIPAVASNDPSVPACFYPSNDYTCVKDGEAMWWDPKGTDTSYGSPPPYQGCWRAVQNGHRHLIGNWPAENVDAEKVSSDPCNNDQ